MELIKVAATSRTNAVAGAIAGVLRDHGQAAVQAIGAQAVSQATKAVAVARLFLAEEDLDLVFVPTMLDVDLNGEIRTAIRLIVYSQPRTNNCPSQRPQDGDEEGGC